MNRRPGRDASPRHYSTPLLPSSPLPPAFTLVELLVCLAIVAVLSGIAWPAYQYMAQTSRASACMSNLRQIGAALNLYLGDHNMVMPTLKAGRGSLGEDVPVIDNTLDAYVHDSKVFACPADTAGQAKKTGTSYFWNPALDGQALATLNFLQITGASMIPVLSDKSAFHPYLPSKVNLLYADGHTDKEISFAKPSPTP